MFVIVLCFLAYVCYVYLPSNKQLKALYIKTIQIPSVFRFSSDAIISILVSLFASEIYNWMESDLSPTKISFH